MMFTCHKVFRTAFKSKVVAAVGSGPLRNIMPEVRCTLATDYNTISLNTTFGSCKKHNTTSSHHALQNLLLKTSHMMMGTSA